MNSDDIKSLHWSEIIAKKVSEKQKPPFVVAAGITPSGPVHPGTLCEFLFAYAISKQLEKYGQVRYIFVSDDFDDLDSVPEPLKKYEKVIFEDMGQPLCIARDPAGCHKSFADHFIAETKTIMNIFGVSLEFLRASDLYSKGYYDEYAKMLCEKKDEVKEIVRVSSNREEMPSDWFPIIPLCERCSNLSKNVILEYHSGEYSYRCSKCGYAGKDKIENHHYKLLFRLDWPTRQKFLNVSVEGGSVDHHSPGGTISTLIAIHKHIYKEEPPFLYKFGLLKYMGKKYSKSKGIGHTVNELLELLPVELIKYILFRPDIDEDKELAITKETLFPLLDEFKYISSVDKTSKNITRADYKKAIAFELCEAKTIWKADISDMVIYYNIYEDWDRVGKLLDDAQGVKYLQPYIDKWLSRGLVPDRYVFKISLAGEPSAAVREFFLSLDESMNAETIHNTVFAVAQKLEIEPKQLFKECYQWILGRETGPRLGKLIYAVGVKRFKENIKV
ncbi:MAG: lysine--tRNA ligase [Candidatus Bilamarchaeaceae archaeon]